MFCYLKGKLTYKGDRFVALDVGGVGFRVYTSAENLRKLGLNEIATLYTYMNIKEDLMEIYGFLTQEELSFFEQMITVSGVGPRAAISILSSLSVNDIVRAIMTNDAKALSRAQGVGAKTAQRLILELKDKVSAPEYNDNPSYIQAHGSKSEALSALLALGYGDREARDAIEAVPGGLDVEATVKEALKKLMR